MIHKNTLQNTNDRVTSRISQQTRCKLYRILTIGRRHESHNKPGVNFTEY